MAVMEVRVVLKKGRYYGLAVVTVTSSSLGPLLLGIRGMSVIIESGSEMFKSAIAKVYSTITTIETD